MIEKGRDFPERVKREARKLSAQRCCLSRTRVGDDVHHIVPREDGGGNDLANAAFLCVSCHANYGSRKEKQRRVRELVTCGTKPFSVRFINPERVAFSRHWVLQCKYLTIPCVKSRLVAMPIGKIAVSCRAEM
jgi:hypothetical protein